MSNIEWLAAPGTKPVTWNPITGCHSVLHSWKPYSPGCMNCWAEKMARTRLAGRHGYHAVKPFRITTHWDKLTEPLHWRIPRTVFVVSMGDLFHSAIPWPWIDRVFDIIKQAAPIHTFILCTKRAEGMKDYLLTCHPDLAQTHPNVWGLVTVEDQLRADQRIPHLIKTPLAVRGLSMEPLLEDVDLSPYLLYNPVQGEVPHGDHQEQRANCLPGRGGWGTGDRLRGQDLESGSQKRGPLEGRDSLYPLSEEEGRARHGTISSSESNGPREAYHGHGPSASLSSFSRSYPRGQNDQPRERSQKGESAREPGNRHVLRANDPCDSCPQNAPSRPPVGTRQPCRQVDHGTGSGNPRPQSSGGKTGPHRQGLWDSIPNGLKDRTQRTPISWIILGGESGRGPKIRPFPIQSAITLASEAKDAGVPVFVKQMGSIWAIAEGTWSTDPKGSYMPRFPVSLQVRQWPIPSPEVDQLSLGAGL